MPHIFIIYDTRDGQCERISRAMVEIVRFLGHKATAENVGSIHGHVVTSFCDGVIIGGPIHAGSHSDALRNFVETNRIQLRLIPSAFFSVSLSAAGSANQRNDARRCMHEFLAQTHFHPLESVILAGAVKYREYGFIKRLMMKQIVGLGGGSTDTSRNHEYTNWPEVSQFVERFLAKAGIEAFSS